MNSLITTDILSDKEEYTKQFTSLVDSVITSAESLFAPILFGPDQAELSKLDKDKRYTIRELIRVIRKES